MTISSQPRSRAPRAPFRRVALLGALLLVLGSGCGDSEPAPATPEPAPGSKAAPAPPGGSPIGRAAPAPTPEPSDRSDPRVQIGEAGTLPEGFPEDLPIYPAARPTRWVAGEGAGAVAVFESDGDPGAVYEFFTAELPGAGWEIESHTASAVHWTVVAGKSGRTARISIVAAPEGGGAQFGVAVAGGG